MSVHELFDERALETIRGATARAESRSAGEVVSYVVGRCDEYEETWWLGATIGALLAAIGAALWLRHSEHWGVSELWIAAPPFLGAIAGYALARWVEPVRRALLREPSVAARVTARAEAAFLEEEVFATRDRTGVLIFIAVFEHRVVILRDAGINALVAPEAWDAITTDLARGLHDGRPVEALLEALERCGTLLEEHGVERRDDDRNELPNALRLRDF